MKDRTISHLRAWWLAAGLLVTPAALADTIDVTANISGNVTWRATNEYILNTLIYVLQGATLNLEPGTVVKGLPGQDAATTGLIVSRGAKIFALGTAEKPIIFTAEADDVNDPNDLGVFQRGLWGGVVIMGNSVLNTSVNATGNSSSPKYDLFEGLTDAEVNGQFINRFGGNDDNDDSGIFRYVSIRHAGVVFAPNKELNGLSLCAVGRGTTIDHVETYATADDGFEFFGGTVNTKYLVSAFNDDDCFDTDQGYRGKSQFWFAIQEDGKRDNGGELNGEPNGLAANNTPVANFEVYNATWIGGGATGANAAANHAMTIREYAAPKIYNSIFHDFKGSGVQITDVRSGLHLTNGLLDLRDNIWGTFASPVAGPGAALLFSDLNRRNFNIDPRLMSISRQPNGELDPRPRLDSPALSGGRTPPNDGFYTPTSYKGAFGSDLWVRGWTFLSQRGFLRQSDDLSAPPVGAPVTVDVVQNISGTTTWTRGNEYVLNGLIYVLSGAVLNIEAGTVVKGLPGQDAATTGLIVSRGARIYARGTATLPIIFTAEADDVSDPNDLGLFQRGLWGGVVILGSSVLNTAVNATGNSVSPKYDIFEGLTDAEVNGQFINRFGGNDDNDDSGVFSYVSIRHAGVVFAPNKELNGLSLCAVGRGTTIDHVETYAIADDGFEFFGGTVNTKYLVSAFNDDDCFDTDQGYRGKGQFWFAIQEDGKRDNGGELNGEPNGLAANNTPVANFEVYNATWIGGGATGANAAANHAMTIREYAAPKIYNSIFHDFKGSGAQITDVRSGLHLTNGLLDLRDNIWGTFASPVAGPGAALLFSDPARNNQNVDPLLTGISRTTNGLLDPRPRSDSPALVSPRTAPNDGFYSPVQYMGAFDETNLWLRSWTFLDQRGFLPSSGSVIVPPTLRITSDTAAIVVSFTAQAGATYRIESSTDLGNAAGWTLETTITTPGPVNQSFPPSGPQRFFRVTFQ